MKNFSNPKVALIYDRVNTPHGGAEKVLLALHKAFPNAPLYTSVYNPKKAKWAKVFNVKTTFLQKIPFAKNLHRWMAPLMPIAFESLDLSEYQIIISITSAEAKGVITNPNQLHVCYLLTPTRYLYQDKEKGLKASFILKLPPLKWLANKFLSYLTWWDQVAINRPDIIIPISRRVSKRIKQYYPNIKPEEAFYPPVEFKNTKLKKQKQLAQLGKYFLIVSRLVSYKKIEIAIQACSDLEKKLIIVGSGPEKNKLKKLVEKLKARHLIGFLENISTPSLHKLYKNCQAVIMPGEEDFGIVALEANAFGKPVLVNEKSGVAELIKHNTHGIHIKQESVLDLTKAIKNLERINFDSRKIRQNPRKYGTSMFVDKFSHLVKTKWETKYPENKR